MIRATLITTLPSMHIRRNTNNRVAHAHILHVLTVLSLFFMSPIPSVAQTNTDRRPLSSTLESVKHVAGPITDQLTIKTSVFNSGTTAIPTDRIRAELYISSDGTLDADDDMLVQKTLTAQLVENAEKKGQEVTTVALEPRQTATIKLKAQALPAILNMFAVVQISSGDGDAETTHAQQVGQAGCEKHILFLSEPEPNDDQPRRRSKIKPGQCLSITGNLDSRDRIDRFFTIPAGDVQQQLDISIDAEATVRVSVSLLTDDIVLKQCMDSLECRVVVAEAVDRIDLTVIPEGQAQTGWYTINIRSTILLAPSPSDPEESTTPTESSPAIMEDVVINEIFPAASQVELHNRGSTPVNIGGFWLCHTTPALIYIQMPPDTIIQPSGFVVVHWGIDGTDTTNEVFTFPSIPIPMNIPHGEFALYTPFPFAEENFADSALIIDYVQWGETGHFREEVAAQAGIWPQGQFVPAPNADQSLALNATGNAPEAWILTTPTMGSGNTAQ